MIRSKAEGNICDEQSYPKMMYAENPEMIVFFAKEGAGIVVYDPLGDRMGEYSEAWLMHNFKPWRGTVTLTQD